MSKFEDFLIDKHAEGYIGCDDDMPDGFNEWLGVLSIDDWLEYGDQFAKKLNADLLEACKKAIVFIEYAQFKLEEGKAVLGNQFPKKEDADNEMKRLQQAIAKEEEK